MRDNGTTKRGSVQTSLDVVVLSSFFSDDQSSIREEKDNYSSYTKLLNE